MMKLVIINITIKSVYKQCFRDNTDSNVYSPVSLPCVIIIII